MSNVQNTPEISEPKSVRFLKVYGSSPKADQYGNYTFYPQIKLFGKWLKAAGFQQGQTIKISIENGKLLIEPRSHEQPEALPTVDA